MATRSVRMSIGLVLVVFGLFLMVGEQAHAQMAEPQASSASPDAVVDESLMDWTTGGSMLYWGDNVPGTGHCSLQHRSHQCHLSIASNAAERRFHAHAG